MTRAKTFLVWLVIIAVVAAVGGALREWREPRREALAPAPTGAEFTGRARVVDGDSLEVAGRRVRLFGIDAPEGPQDCRDTRGRRYPCGEDARRALIVAIGGRPVTCTPAGVSYDRQVAVCTADGRDLGESMIRQGHALELRTHSHGRYAAAEREARQARRGLWAGSFEQPAEWRREHPR